MMPVKPQRKPLISIGGNCSIPCLVNAKPIPHKRGTEIAKDRGLILVDTKYEFGKNSNGEIVWAGNTYQRFPVQVEGFKYQKGQLPRPTLTVSNVLGKEVYVSSNFVNRSFNKTIDLSEFGKGVYLLTIRNSETSITEKIIIE